MRHSTTAGTDKRPREVNRPKLLLNRFYLYLNLCLFVLFVLCFCFVLFDSFTFPFILISVYLFYLFGLFDILTFRHNLDKHIDAGTDKRPREVNRPKLVFNPISHLS